MPKFKPLKISHLQSIENYRCIESAQRAFASVAGADVVPPIYFTSSNRDSTHLPGQPPYCPNHFKIFAR